MSVVRFNRKFTQEQLTAAEGLSTIADVAVIDGAWYIAKVGATAIYIGSKEGASTAILKKIANITDLTGLDATVTKSASGASNSASSRSSSVQVVSGFTIEEVDGQLVASASSVTSTAADEAGAASKAYDDAKTYADQLIADLGTIMHFEGVAATEADLKSTVTTPKKGDVWIVSEDGSEWVYSGESVDASHPYDTTKWEKFGSTKLDGALYLGTNTVSSGSFVIADGTDGKMKAISDADIATRLNYKSKQTAVVNPTASGVAGYAITEISQDENGVISASRAAIPSGSGSVGTTSAASDAWKTVVHDTMLSDHSLSGNTVAIPAAGTSSDGYMSSASYINLNTAILALTWDE